jgi:hypothetical protein
MFLTNKDSTSLKPYICVTRNVNYFVYDEVWLGPLYSIYILLNTEYIFALKKHLQNNMFSIKIFLPFNQYIPCISS